MIIPNGTIELKYKKGGGIDATTGHPLPITHSWGYAIPCQYVPNKQNLQAKSSNEQRYVASSYSIFLEQPQTIDSEQLRIVGSDGKVIGEYSIISVENLNAVCEIKIVV